MAAVTTYIRPGQYTKEFVDANDTFTIAFFNSEYQDALNICGTISGRDEDKVKKAKLTPYFTDGTVAFQEASMILVCKKDLKDTCKIMISALLQGRNHYITIMDMIV